jgi:hypothetical protein
MSHFAVPELTVCMLYEIYPLKALILKIRIYGVFKRLREVFSNINFTLLWKYTQRGMFKETKETVWNMLNDPLVVFVLQDSVTLSNHNEPDVGCDCIKFSVHPSLKPNSLYSPYSRSTVPTGNKSLPMHFTLLRSTET